MSLSPQQWLQLLPYSVALLLACRITWLLVLPILSAALRYRLLRVGLWPKLSAAPSEAVRLSRFLAAANPERDGWALVTGATDGIGRALANQLARLGLNVALLSRSEARLRDTEEEIRAACPSVQLLSIPADLSQPPAAWLPRVSAQLISRCPTGRLLLLVHNVGMALPHPQPFASLNSEFVASLVRCNLHCCVALTDCLMPLMPRRLPGRPEDSRSPGSLALYVGSGTAREHRSPAVSLYSASKHFVDVYARRLGESPSSEGVGVVSVIPFFVATKMTGMQSGWLALSPEVYAASLLIGLRPECRVDRLCGHFLHEAQAAVLHCLLPQWLYTWGMLGLATWFDRLVRRVTSAGRGGKSE